VDGASKHGMTIAVRRNGQVRNICAVRNLCSAIFAHWQAAPCANQRICWAFRQATAWHGLCSYGASSLKSVNAMAAQAAKRRTRAKDHSSGVKSL
jgi:hypothetical protein